MLRSTHPQSLLQCKQPLLSAVVHVAYTSYTRYTVFNTHPQSLLQRQQPLLQCAAAHGQPAVVTPCSRLQLSKSEVRRHQAGCSSSSSSGGSGGRRGSRWNYSEGVTAVAVESSSLLMRCRASYAHPNHHTPCNYRNQRAPCAPARMPRTYRSTIPRCKPATATVLSLHPMHTPAQLCAIAASCVPHKPNTEQAHKSRL
jgi:hypothetical protein